MSLLAITRAAAAELEQLRFGPPVDTVYNPLQYAWKLHAAFLQRYARGRKEVLLLGMNPGPFGMVQTGVPFGEVEAVRSWLRLRGEVQQPARVHAKRPIQGLDCRRSEVSGRRLWGWAAERWVTPQRFLRRFHLHNYCPLAFVGASGANLTPDKLAAAEAAPLFAICDRLLRQVVHQIRPRVCIGIGNFAEQRLQQVLAGTEVAIARMPHPSPANPAANLGWARLADQALAAAGIDVAQG